MHLVHGYLPYTNNDLSTKLTFLSCIIMADGKANLSPWLAFLPSSPPQPHQQATALGSTDYFPRNDAKCTAMRLRLCNYIDNTISVLCPTADWNSRRWNGTSPTAAGISTQWLDQRPFAVLSQPPRDGVW